MKNLCEAKIVLCFELKIFIQNFYKKLQVHDIKIRHHIVYHGVLDELKN